jgi:hypothetical protein
MKIEYYPDEERLPENVERHLSETRKLLLSLKDDLRRTFLEKLGFCRYCGRDTEGGYCHCMNDE